MPDPLVPIRRHLLVYLSGPITPAHGYSVAQNVASAADVFLACVRRGIPVICPHLSGLVEAAWAIPHAHWITLDLALIDRCTHVLTLPRWETSPGAQIEVAHARLQGIPVVGDVMELP
jgi:hypothetical protein